MKVKGFQQQFSECSKNGMHGKGRLEKFKDFPELLPHPFHKAARIVAKKLEKDPELGLETIACLKFGGDCRSDNPACRKLRGMEPTERMNVSQEEYIRICNSPDKYRRNETRDSKVERGLCDTPDRHTCNCHRV